MSRQTPLPWHFVGASTPDAPLPWHFQVKCQGRDLRIEAQTPGELHREVALFHELLLDSFSINHYGFYLPRSSLLKYIVWSQVISYPYMFTQVLHRLSPPPAQPRKNSQHCNSDATTVLRRLSSFDSDSAIGSASTPTVLRRLSSSPPPGKAWKP